MTALTILAAIILCLAANPAAGQAPAKQQQAPAADPCGHLRPKVAVEGFTAEELECMGKPKEAKEARARAQAWAKVHAAEAKKKAPKKKEEEWHVFTCPDGSRWKIRPTKKTYEEGARRVFRCPGAFETPINTTIGVMNFERPMEIVPVPN